MVMASSIGFTSPRTAVASEVSVATSGERGRDRRTSSARARERNSVRAASGEVSGARRATTSMAAPPRARRPGGPDGIQ